MSEDLGEGKIKFFWNEDALLKQALIDSQASKEIACSATVLASNIRDAHPMFDKYRVSDAVSFWVQVESLSTFSNSDIVLYITPPDGAETRQDAVFYDDQIHNDFGYGDNIFGATIKDGFQAAGTYQFRVTLTDAGGNVSEKTGSFEVAGTGSDTCTPVQVSGDPKDKINIVFMAEEPALRPFADSRNAETFSGLVKDWKDWFFSKEPFSGFKDKFNVYALTIPNDFKCTSETFNSKGENNSERTSLRCDRAAIDRAARSCIPKKEGLRVALQDKIVVIPKLEIADGSNATGNTALISKTDLTPSVVGHELGHTFEILDYYFTQVGQALGVGSVKVLQCQLANTPTNSCASDGTCTPGTGDAEICTSRDTGTDCSADPRLQCIMCDQSSYFNYSCGLTLRDHCNMSV
ncbi:MAG: hypothetical protein Q7R47_05695, partial [Candidatus Diapherotrites archaeon]|nr:hypothetical protein [Candidatus Diapherotrites archaeon]